jgi:hypothetical protein
LIVVTLEEGLIVRWTLGSGVECASVDLGWSLVTSSWWRTDEVASWRGGRFEDWIQNGSHFDGQLPTFNVLQEPGTCEYSPFMTRSFSGTRSVTQISMDRKRPSIQVRYWAREGEGMIDPSQMTAHMELPLSPIFRGGSIPSEPGDDK